MGFQHILTFIIDYKTLWINQNEKIPTCPLWIARSLFNLLRTSDCFKAGIIPVRLNIPLLKSKMLVTSWQGCLVFMLSCNYSQFSVTLRTHLWKCIATWHDQHKNLSLQCRRWMLYLMSLITPLWRVLWDWLSCMIPGLTGCCCWQWSVTPWLMTSPELLYDKGGEMALLPHMGNIHQQNHQTNKTVNQQTESRMGKT